MNIDDFMELSDSDLAEYAVRKMKQYNAGVLDLTNASDISDDELVFIVALDRMFDARGLVPTLEGWAGFSNFVYGELARRNGI